MIGALFISFMVADENLPIIGFFWEIPNPIYQAPRSRCGSVGAERVVALVFRGRCSAW